MSSYLRILPSSFWKFAANWGPRSEMTLSKSTKREYSFQKMIVAIPSAVTVFFMGHRITPFVSPWSTMTKRESKLLQMGRLVIK